MQCLTPISLKRNGSITSEGSQLRHVPCGKCVNCLTNRRNEWSTRLKIEHKYSTSSFFITLTYNDENIRYNEFCDYNTGEIRYVQTIVKKDLQDWFKRIRKYSECRYYAVGEYGTHTKRPHYHILLFNYNIDHLYRLQSSWPFGYIQIGSISDQSIMYVCKYHVNKTDYPDNANPSFALMSRRPGIGAVFVEKMQSYYEGKKDRTFFPDHNGIKRRLPRYLRDKLYTKDEKMFLRYHHEKEDLSPQQYVDRFHELNRQFKVKINKRQKI